MTQLSKAEQAVFGADTHRDPVTGEIIELGSGSHPHNEARNALAVAVHNHEQAEAKRDAAVSAVAVAETELEKAHERVVAAEHEFTEVTGEPLVADDTEPVEGEEAGTPRRRRRRA